MDRPTDRTPRAVTPVIGIVLMVAVVVILAAVVGAYALAFEGPGDAAPNVRLDATYDERTSHSGQYLNVTVEGGDRVPTSELTFVVDGATDGGGADNPLTGDPLEQIGDDLVTADVVSLNATSFDSDPIVFDDATVTLVWDPDPDSAEPGQTQPLWTWEAD